MIHNIKLTHRISSIDVWERFLLIGSTIVHVVDTTRKGDWRRVIVIHMEERESLKVVTVHDSIDFTTL